MLSTYAAFLSCYLLKDIGIFELLPFFEDDIDMQIPITDVPVPKNFSVSRLL
jgi:hypothetical protein